MTLIRGDILQPIPIAPIGAVSTSSMLWRTQGIFHVTVIVKAVFRLENGTRMVLDVPEDVIAHESHHGGDPTRSLRTATERIAFRPSCDVYCTGEAHAPAGVRVRTSAIRLGLFQGHQPVLDKWLIVQGERGQSSVRPELFQSIPVCYERAEHDSQTNPVGCEGQQSVANISAPQMQGGVPGFGPVSRYWRARRNCITADERHALNKAVPEFTENFDWSFFQSAPIDQQVAYLQGDEWLVLEGLHPSRRRVQSKLPNVHAVARIWGAGVDDVVAGEDIRLVADTLAIDASTEKCVVVWRGSLPLHDAGAMTGARVAAGIEIDSEGTDWRRVLQGAEVVPDLSWLTGKLKSMVPGDEGGEEFGGRPTLVSLDNGGGSDRSSVTLESYGAVSIESTAGLGSTLVDPPRTVPQSDLGSTLIDPPRTTPQSDLGSTLIDPPRTMPQSDLGSTLIDPPRTTPQSDLGSTLVDFRAQVAEEPEETEPFRRISLEEIKTRSARRESLPGSLAHSSEATLRDGGIGKDWRASANPPLDSCDVGIVEKLLRQAGAESEDLAVLLNSYAEPTV